MSFLCLDFPAPAPRLLTPRLLTLTEVFLLQQLNNWQAQNDFAANVQQWKSDLISQIDAAKTDFQSKIGSWGSSWTAPQHNWAMPKHHNWTKPYKWGRRLNALAKNNWSSQLDAIKADVAALKADFNTKVDQAFAGFQAKHSAWSSKYDWTMPKYDWTMPKHHNWTKPYKWGRRLNALAKNNWAAEVEAFKADLNAKVDQAIIGFQTSLSSWSLPKNNWSVPQHNWASKPSFSWPKHNHTDKYFNKYFG